MRITNNMINRDVVDDVHRHLNDMAILRKEISTGKRVQSLSRDAVAATRSLAFASAQSTLEQYKVNTEESLAWMTATSAGLARVRETMQDAKLQAQTGATDTVSEDTRKSIAINVHQLRNTLLEVGNSEWNGSRLFGGHKTSTPVFTSDGTYQGDSGTLQRDIAANETAVINVTGQRVFLEGTNLFQTLTDLETALNANDAPGVRSLLTQLDEGLNQVLTVEAEMGAEINRVENTQTRLDELTVTLTERRSANDDADVSKAAVELTNLDNLYQSALAATAQLFNHSLLDFLK